jgi:hypothetical protein
MATQKQIEANRRNAQQSTGPRTSNGKARVASNALKHGLTAEQIVLPGENLEEFIAFRDDLLNSLYLHGQLETVLGEKLVTDFWRQRRVPTIEAALYRRYRLERMARYSDRKQFEDRQCSPRDLVQALGIPESQMDKVSQRDRQDREEEALVMLRNEPLVELTMALEDYHEIFTNLWRHEIALARSASRTLHELQRLQAIRAGERVPAPTVMDVDVKITQDEPANPELIFESKLPSTDPTPAKVELDPKSQEEDGKAQISFLITNSQKAQLRERGCSSDEIAKMKPAEAHRILGLT